MRVKGNQSGLVLYRVIHSSLDFILLYASINIFTEEFDNREFALLRNIPLESGTLEKNGS
jgi:hypothetical protein